MISVNSFHKTIPFCLCLVLFFSVSACGGSKAAPDNSEEPVEVGDEDQLALPPE